MSKKNLILTAMVFACAMTFIDQTIVAIAIPDIIQQLGISQSAAQWVINGYLLALAALFAFGGKLGDVYGRRNMVTIGVIGFAFCSAMCGLTPDSGIADTWLIGFRVFQGAFAALLFPAAVGIVVASFEVEERGKAMALFFGITGGLTAVGPFAGGYLVEWTWRAIFWINIPVAIIALILIYLSKPENEKRPQRLDYAGTALVSGSMGLIVLALQQTTEWGWIDPRTIGCIVVGVVLGFLFVRRELGIDFPLLQLNIFRDRGFSADNMIMGLMSIAFVPFFLFGSEYAQIALGQDASQAGLFLMYFFIGFVIAAQIGGRMLDKGGAKRPVLIGSAVAAVGFYLVGNNTVNLDMSDMTWPLIIAGAGVGFILGPVSTDALNRAAASAYSEVTGITQTARNLGASLGLAVLGSILISETNSNLTEKLGALGVSQADALKIADSLSSGPTSTGGAAPSKAMVQAVQSGYAESMQVVFYIMAGVFVVTYILGHVWMVGGKPAVVRPEEATGDEEPVAAPAS